MGYTSKQAERIAKQILDRWGPSLANAVNGTAIPAAFLAGFVGVECGKDRRGILKPEATRFEPHVYRRLIAVRDRKARTYSNIKPAQLANYADEHIRRLATSHGPGQIMGWHTINSLSGRGISDLSAPDTMFVCMVELLEVVAGPYIRRSDWGSVLRIWNTGRPNGKTYHADYVSNALAVMESYRLQAKNKIFELSAAAAVPAKPAENAAPVPPNDDPSEFESTPLPGSLESDHVNAENAAADEGTTEGKATVNGTPPTGFFGKIWKWIVGIVTGTILIPEGVTAWLQDASFKEILIAALKGLGNAARDHFATIIVAIVVAVVVWYVTKKFNNYQVTKLLLENNAKIVMPETKATGPIAAFARLFK